MCVRLLLSFRPFLKFLEFRAVADWIKRYAGQDIDICRGAKKASISGPEQQCNGLVAEAARRLGVLFRGRSRGGCQHLSTHEAFPGRRPDWSRYCASVGRGGVGISQYGYTESASQADLIPQVPLWQRGELPVPRSHGVGGAIERGHYMALGSGKRSVQTLVSTIGQVLAE